MPDLGDAFSMEGMSLELCVATILVTGKAHKARTVKAGNWM